MKEKGKTRNRKKINRESQKRMGRKMFLRVYKYMEKMLKIRINPPLSTIEIDFKIKIELAFFNKQMKFKLIGFIWRE